MTHQMQTGLGLRRFTLCPVQTRILRRFDGKGAGRLVTRPRLAILRGEFAPPALLDRDRQLAVKIAEEGESLGAAPFLAHEQQRDLRRQQSDGQRRLDRVGFGQRFETIAIGAIADLVVVLQEIDEGGRA